MYLKLKNFFDPFFGLLLIFIFLPLILIISILVFFLMGKPIFFSQKRPGLNGKLFDFYKFRTMTEKENKDQLENSRITPIGKFLRNTSLDELPSLLNVLKGDMSLVGPRPLLAEYLNLYNSEQQKRHNLKPGITGYAQVNGRNLIDWKKKFQLDIYYINNVSFFLDLSIILKTIYKVLKKEGINYSTEISAEKFRGNEKE